ncbi:transglutaminase family protein [Ideonella sp. A 288]|uniref:transglutaminase-like domain-containing protein n=1 Tax=Ideonella sp. A 288 TaxID=1962181 RepID=UPI000B4BF74F|nr:transglutaminase family protein [Ideonella sp. A 288]
MNRIELQIDLHYEIQPPGAEFVFNIHAAETPNQRVSAERLSITPAIAPVMHTDLATGTRGMRLRADAGTLQVSYAATVDLLHHRADPALLDEVPASRLPPEALSYLYPSRYCQSDRLLTMAGKAFGRLAPGYGRVLAIRDWVHGHVTFKSHSSDAHTSAIDTLIEEVGVCRDFAHLMIALCRAVGIPARYATGTDYGADPALGPPDFQAYVEVFLHDRWYLFDPSGTAIPMGFVRLATGRDAADVAFASIFGDVRSHAATVRAVAVEDAAQGWVRPHLCDDALSTDGGVATAQPALAA